MVPKWEPRNLGYYSCEMSILKCRCVVGSYYVSEVLIQQDMTSYFIEGPSGSIVHDC